MSHSLLGPHAKGAASFNLTVTHWHSPNKYG